MIRAITLQRLAPLCLLAAFGLAGCASASAEPPRQPEEPRAEDDGSEREPVGEVVIVRPEPVTPEAAPPEPEPEEPEPEEPEPVVEEEEPVVEEDEPAAPASAIAARRRAVRVLPDAILPRQRIVAFYGNPASTRMGILGELPPDRMLARLDREIERWREADPSTPVKPALHMIAVMATGDPGADSTYRLRMPERRVRDVMAWAERRDALVFLDIQPGLSSVAAELPSLEKWLRLPHVHLALDPEWDMPAGSLPGKRIGTMSAADVNRAIDFLAGLVEEHDLPPKVLVVHRFTQSMLTGATTIKDDPRVQVVINMDGWGPPAQKRQTYRQIVEPEATQFTGFKLFFKHDVKSGRMLTPQELVRLNPPPVYIQYQ